MLAKKRNRYFIESIEKIGKTTLFFMLLLDRIRRFKEAGQEGSPIIIYIYPHKSNLTAICKELDHFRAIYEDLPLDLIFLDAIAAEKGL